MSFLHYILVGTEPRVEPDMMAWARWFETAERHVALDTIGEATVSTVFLGLDHRFTDRGPPILFETMVFGGKLDGEMVRYCTFAEAAAGHADMVARIRRADLRLVSSR